MPTAKVGVPRELRNVTIVNISLELRESQQS